VIYFIFVSCTVILTLELILNHSQAEPEIRQAKIVPSLPEVLPQQTGQTCRKVQPVADLRPRSPKKICRQENITWRLKRLTINCAGDIRLLLYRPLTATKIGRTCLNLIHRSIIYILHYAVACTCIKLFIYIMTKVFHNSSKKLYWFCFWYTCI
jgi:hypothetical protein